MYPTAGPCSHLISRSWTCPSLPIWVSGLLYLSVEASKTLFWASTGYSGPEVNFSRSLQQQYSRPELSYTRTTVQSAISQASQLLSEFCLAHQRAAIYGRFCRFAAADRQSTVGVQRHVIAWLPETAAQSAASAQLQLPIRTRGGLGR